MGLRAARPSRLLPAMHRLWLATRNRHKTTELRAMLGADFALEDLSAHPEIGEVVEDGSTFAENAGLKAMAISRQLPGLALADDSGLEVDSLGGAPGIYSARYAGPAADDEENRRKLLAALVELGPGTSRRGRFRSVLALARAGVVLATFDGVVEGMIVQQERGDFGFGYDSLFVAEGFERTFAELPAAEKNRLSHRAMAVAKLRAFFVQS